MVESADVITQDSEKYVERLLTLFKRFSRLVSEAFRDDPRFLTSRDKAFKRVVNDTSIFRLELPNRPSGYHTKTLPESKCPELLGNLKLMQFIVIFIHEIKTSRFWLKC